MNVCVVQPNGDTVSETFLRGYEELFPGRVTVLCGIRPRIKGRRLTLADRLERLGIRASRYLQRQPVAWEVTQLMRRVIERHRPQVILAQYGPTGVRLSPACALARVPLVVYFHGGDANNYETVRTQGEAYRRMFQQAAGIVAVSRAMVARLHELGAPLEKLHYVPSGACCTRFHGAAPQAAPPRFLAVGRFIECKGQPYALAAFAEVLRQVPAARLKLIGEGAGLAFARQLAVQLGIAHAVEFLGPQSHDRVAAEMRAARAVVHPSLVASTGDSEGTPVVVMEAGAAGLPVVATRVGGIPEVVLHEQTGLLVEPRQITELAAQMLRLAQNPPLAGRLGAAASQRIRQHFSRQACLAALWNILRNCASANGEPGERARAAA